MHAPDLPPRLVTVPEGAAGMRLDRFLAKWFRSLSRTELAHSIRRGEVRMEGRALRASHRVRASAVLALYTPGIAADTPAPPFPDILLEQGHLIVVNKPAGLLCHPAGTSFSWAVIGLAKARWPRAELVHRLDRDTSGCLALTSDPVVNVDIKQAIAKGATQKVYEAICKGVIPWDERTLDGPIGHAGGVIRIQMAVRPDGKSARTDVTVLERSATHTRVRCRIYTGRTHQIRVHLAHAGFPLLGDRMYGVPPDIFLHSLDHGIDERVILATGAIHHALHAARLTVPLGAEDVTIEAPWPDELQAWWDDPSIAVRSASANASQSTIGGGSNTGGTSASTS